MGPMAAERAQDWEPIDLDAHRGSKRAMHIRDGLVDAKHRAAMGDSIWLYLYFHKHAGFKTGTIRHYQHEVAKDELGVCLRTVKAYLSKLEKAGYVTVQRHKTYAEVTITGYFQQPNTRATPTYSVQHSAQYSEDSVQNVAQDDASKTGEVCNILPHSVQHLSRGTTSPLVINKDVPPTAVGGDEPATASEPMTDDVRSVAAAWMRANGINPSKAHPATVVSYEHDAEEALSRGAPAADMVGCLGDLARESERSGKNWRVTPRILSDRIGRWQRKHSRADPESRGDNGADADLEPFTLCRCGVPVGQNGRHVRGCGLDGPVDWDNYVDLWGVFHGPDAGAGDGSDNDGT